MEFKTKTPDRKKRKITPQGYIPVTLNMRPEDYKALNKEAQKRQMNLSQFQRWCIEKATSH
jgi:hypothetical protein